MTTRKPRAVLAHGAFADSSSRNGVMVADTILTAVTATTTQEMTA